MKLRRVDPLTIKIPEERVTARMDEEKSAQFDASVKAIGIDEPIRCFEVDGELYLSDGLHRLVAAINNKIDRVDVLVKPGTMRDVLFHNLRSGHLRGKHPVSEMRKQIEKAYTEFNIGIEDIVKESGLTRDYVEKLLIISELTPMCLEALDEERIGIGVASELVKIEDPVGQEVALSYILSNHWKVQQTREYVAQVLIAIQQREQAPPPPPPQPPPGVKCGFCGEEHTPMELASILCCHGCQGIMYEAIAIARREAEKAAAAAKTEDEALKQQNKARLGAMTLE
jgi:ParB-like chromosome segregation protein Spo0J